MPVMSTQNNALNAIIMCANNIKKKICFFVMAALKRRLKIEHFTEQQFLQKYDTFCGYFWVIGTFS